MLQVKLPKSLADIPDLDLLILSCEPSFLETRTSLELELM